MSAKKRDGIVYSTNPDFEFNNGTGHDETKLPPAQQLLYVWIESKGRGGKTVTLVKGYRGNSADLEQLSASIKRHCGTGGSVKNGEIIIQGDFRNKVITFLNGKGYKTKKAGG